MVGRGNSGSFWIQGAILTSTSVIDFSWDNLPSKRDLNSQLERMALPADAKVLMGQLLSTTVDVAGRMVEIGRQILAFVFELVRMHPGTLLGAAVGVIVTMVVGSIPFLGVVLGPLIGPLLAAFLITQGALTDLRNSTIAKQAELFSAKLDAVLARG